MIYVWAYEQKRKGEISFYLQTGSSNETNDDGDGDQYRNRTKDDIDSSSLVKKSLPIHENRTNFKVQDNLVPWDLKTKNDGKSSSDERFLRFYHVFKEGELENVCRSIENCFVTKSFYEQGNWCVVIEKR